MGTAAVGTAAWQAPPPSGQTPGPVAGPAGQDTALRRPSRRREAAAVAALLLLAVLVRLPTLGQPLVGHHGFRETQTAYTAVLYHDHGVDLLHPKLPVLGAPFEVPFEFPLFQALGAAVMSWGVSPDVAMRTTSLACFVLSALLLWGLVRHVAGRTAALATLALFLFTPFSLLWSRASLIEYLAVAGSLGWLWAGLLWRERRRAVYAAAALAGGLTAMLVKPTTAALWVLPLLAYSTVTDGAGLRSWLRSRREPVLAAIVIVPFVAALLWTRHADAIKGASDATRWLTSTGLREWNFGTIDQRLVGGNWTRIMGRITTQLTGYPAWLLPLAALVGLRTRNCRFWAALVAVPILTILVFWNLYVVHDYYLVAASPVLAAVTGFGFARAWHAIDRTRARGLLVALLGTWMVALVVLVPVISTLAYQRFSVDTDYPEAQEAARLTSPTDLVAFDGYGWTPVVPYYSRRAGRMTRSEPAERLTAAELAQAGYRVLVTPRLEGDLAPDTIRAGRWTGVLGNWVYITGDHPRDLRGAPIAATDDPVDGGIALLSEPLTIACGVGALLPRGEGTTVLHLAAASPRTAKLSLAAGYGAVPVRANVLVGPGVGRGPMVVDCRDAEAVTILAVSDRPAG